jgi:hypothetical protein
MLRSHKTGLSAKLWRHGFSLNHEALDDPRRHLSAAVKASTQIGQGIVKLQEIMDDLGHAVMAVKHAGSSAW